MKVIKHSHVLGAALLVAGTSIGAGMLALPIVSAMGGFFYSLIIYLISWAVMTATGLLYLEIALGMKKDSNIISMASKYLGNPGKIFSWIVYLFLFYCLSVAYISQGTGFFKGVLPDGISTSACTLAFSIIFGAFVYIGAKAVDRFNIFLMGGLLLSYFLFVVLGFGHIDFVNLLHFDSKAAMFSFPVILISFGYQGLMPSLTYYMNKDYKKIRLSVILGTSIAFCIYLLWEMLILGIIPLEGADGLKAAFEQGLDAITPLKNYTNIKTIYYIGQFFSFFAVTTSFLGVNLGLFDFIADGFKIPKKGMKKLIVACITFLPSITIVLINPKLFLTALNYAGGIGGSLLLILLPALMVYSKRYFKKEKSIKQLFGGKPVLVLICLFVFFVMFMQQFPKVFFS